MPQINAAGLQLLEQSEGCELQAYKDVAGVWTIGYGHTGVDVYPGLKISMQRAVDLLKSDLARFENAVNSAVSRNLTPNEFSALVDFAYNVGIGAFTSSSLLRCVNAGDTLGAAAQFSRWVYAGGVAQPGLVTRREREKALFIKP